MAGLLTINEITRVAVDVVRTHSFPVKVLGSVPASGGSNYVEILVRLDGPTEDRRMLLGVFRDADVDSLRQQIAEHLRRLLVNRSCEANRSQRCGASTLRSPW